MRHLLLQQTSEQYPQNSQNDASYGNGGSLTTNGQENLKNYGEVWFDERAITNILCLKNMKNKYRVTYDSAQNGTFEVHKPDVQLHFVMHQDGMHYHNTKIVK